MLVFCHVVIQAHTHTHTDKSEGGRVSLDFNDAYHKLQDYCECLGIEVNERINILDMLRNTKEFTTYKLNEFKRTVQVRCVSVHCS